MSSAGGLNTAVPAFRPTPPSRQQCEEARQLPSPRRTPSPPSGLPGEVAPADLRCRGSCTSPATRTQRISAGSRIRFVQDRSRSSGSRPASRARGTIPSREISTKTILEDCHPCRSDALSLPRILRSEADWEVVTHSSHSPSQLPYRRGPRRG